MHLSFICGWWASPIKHDIWMSSSSFDDLHIWFGGTLSAMVIIMEIELVSRVQILVCSILTECLILKLYICHSYMNRWTLPLTIMYKFSGVHLMNNIDDLEVLLVLWLSSWKWNWWADFKSWMRRFALPFVVMALGKAQIHLFFIQLLVNSRANWIL